MVESKPKTQKSLKPPQKLPKRPTPERLANIALHHLDRYASSAENLRRVLERRLFKAARHYEDLDLTEAKGWIDAIIKRYIDSGLLNDRAYAETRARSLLTRGGSTHKIRMKLLEKGLKTGAIDLALEALELEHADPELAAAVTLARRRRLGPYADPAKRTETRDKHLATLARAGFSYDLAQRVIEADSPEELEELLAPEPLSPSTTQEA